MSDPKTVPAWLRAYFRRHSRVSTSSIAEAHKFLDESARPLFFCLCGTIAPAVWSLRADIKEPAKTWFLQFTSVFAAMSFLMLVMPIRRGAVMPYRVLLASMWVYCPALVGTSLRAYFDGQLPGLLCLAMASDGVVFGTVVVAVLVVNIFHVSLPKWQQVTFDHGFKALAEWICAEPDPLSIYDKEARTVEELGRRAKLVVEKYSRLTDRAAGRQLAKDYPDSHYALLARRVAKPKGGQEAVAGISGVLNPPADHAELVPTEGSRGPRDFGSQGFPQALLSPLSAISTSLQFAIFATSSVALILTITGISVAKVSLFGLEFTQLSATIVLWVLALMNVVLGAFFVLVAAAECVDWIRALQSERGKGQHSRVRTIAILMRGVALFVLPVILAALAALVTATRSRELMSWKTPTIHAPAGRR